MKLQHKVGYKGWIPVEELPEDELRKSEVEVICNTTDGVLVGCLTPGKAVFLEEWRGMALPFKVTHWQLLPEGI